MIARHALLLVIGVVVSGCAYGNATTDLGQPIAHSEPADLYLIQAQSEDPALFDADRHSLLERVTRDYNNDGRPDVALSLLDNCGAGSYSTGCDHDLYIARADGGYDYAGVLPAHGETASLVAIAPGSARLTRCNFTRAGPYSMDSYIVTAQGAAPEASETMSQSELEGACPPNDESFPATLELCDVSAYAHTSRCEWHREGE